DVDAQVGAELRLHVAPQRVVEAGLVVVELEPLHLASAGVPLLVLRLGRRRVELGGRVLAVPEVALEALGDDAAGCGGAGGALDAGNVRQLVPVDGLGERVTPGEAGVRPLRGGRLAGG